MKDLIIVGKNQLNSREMRILEKLTSEYYEKIRRTLKKITSVKIVIKKQSKGNAKFSVHVQAMAPARKFVSTHGHDFDFAKALHKAFNDVEIEIEHTLHSGDNLKNIHNTKYFVRKKEFLIEKAKRKKRN